MTFECQSCEQVFDTLADHTVHLLECEGHRRKEGIMEAIIVVMSLLKGTKNTYRYEAEEDNALITSLYVKRTAMQGEPPKSITVTVEVVEVIE